MNYATIKMMMAQTWLCCGKISMLRKMEMLRMVAAVTHPASTLKGILITNTSTRLIFSELM